jgi:hypothetical protein
MTNIELFFKGDLLDIEKESKYDTYSFDSVVYPKVFEDMSAKRAKKYVEILDSIKSKIDKVVKDAELGFNKKSRNLLSNKNKNDIAEEIILLRNEFIDNKNSEIDLIGDSYVSGQNESAKVMNSIIDEKDLYNESVVIALKDEFEEDVNNFIEDFSNKIDNVLDNFDKKNRERISWTWVIVLSMLLNIVSSLEYRIALIAKEPFRKAFKLGVVHGIEKIVEKENREIISIMWYTTGHNPCENCKLLDGQEISIQEAESYVHPNCSCTLRVLVK